MLPAMLREHGRAIVGRATAQRAGWRAACCLLGLLGALATASPGDAQQTTGTTSAAQPAEPAPVAIPVASIAAEDVALDAYLKSLEGQLAAPEFQGAIAKQLPDLASKIQERETLSNARLQRGFGRADLTAMQADWRAIDSRLATWAGRLTDRLATLDAAGRELAERAANWEATAKGAREEQAPADVRARVAHAQEKIAGARTRLRRSRDDALRVQNRVVELRAHVANELQRLAAARDEALSHVLRRIAPPLWAISPGDVEANVQSFATAYQEMNVSLRNYADREGRLLWLHALLTLVLVWLSVRASAWAKLREGHELPPALVHPWAAGLVLGLSNSLWIHADAPPKLSWLLSLLVLPFWVVLLREIVPKPLRRPLPGLVVLVLIDFGRRILLDFEGLSRLLLVIEAVVTFAGLVWLRRPSRLARLPHPANPFWLRLLGGWLRVSMVAAGVATLGSCFGWVILADLLITTVVIGTFVGSILFSAVVVVEGICETAVWTGRLDRLRLVRGDRPALPRVVSRLARTTAFATWLYLLPGYLSIREGLLDLLGRALAAPLGYGSVKITLGGVIAFVVAIWLSWVFSRLVARTLDAEIFPRVSLPRGVPFALSTISRYAVLVIGFVFAVAALGFQVGNLALVISALGVGIGFGLQNVVNNFISGLILLFERPVKVMDVISLDTLLGTITRIGIRSSTLRTFDGADVIVPNGDLISNQVTNWTLADKHRRVPVPVGVVYGTPARRVIELLRQVAHDHPAVLAYPEPLALFMGFGDSSLDFELRFWSEDENALTTVRSEIAVAIQDALAEAGIEVPFPQRDLHLRSVAPEAREALGDKRPDREPRSPQASGPEVAESDAPGTST